MSELLQSGQHPDADQLNAFLEHALPPHEREETLAHLAVCDHCRSVVALSLPPAEEAPRPKLVRSRWFSGWNLAGPAAAALAALVLVGVQIRNKPVVPQQAPAAQMAVTQPPKTVDQLAPQPPRMQSLPSAPAQLAARHSGNSANKAAEPPASEPTKMNDLGVTGGVSTAPAPEMAQNIVGHPVLPSGLLALSAVRNGKQAVAIDANNTPFFSDDDGVHWSAISPQWTGRAVKVQLASANYPAPAVSRLTSSLKLSQPAASATAAVPVDSLAKAKSSMTGGVTDPTGAFIPSASVVVTNMLTLAERTTKTDRGGHYVVDNLDPGTYTVAAEAPGFNPQQHSGITLNPGQKSQSDLTLEIGEAAQSVMVQGANQPAALLSPQVKQMIGVNRAAAPILPDFEITTDSGERWTSTDGRSWKRKQ